MPPITARPTALESRNLRLFLVGVLGSSLGTWVQRIGQDWLVLELTGSPTAVGVATACQFAPTLVIGVSGGALADRYPERAILLFTQVGMALLSAVLALVCLTGQVTLWHAYAASLSLGVLVAIDNPTKQALLSQLVPPAELRHALGLTAAVFQVGAMFGPAIGGLLTGSAGPGWCFAFNSLAYAAPVVALCLMRNGELHRSPRAVDEAPTARAAARLIADSPAMLWPIVLVGVFGAFTLNLPVVLVSLARSEFEAGASSYGLLASVLAAGSLTGALVVSSGRPRPTRLRTLVTTASGLSALHLVMAAAPANAALVAVLFVFGAANLALLTMAQAMVQGRAPAFIRGRVMGIYLVAFFGGGALGGPLTGWVSATAGPREALLVAGSVGALTAAAVGLRLAGKGTCGSSSARARGRAVRLATCGS